MVMRSSPSQDTVEARRRGLILRLSKRLFQATNDYFAKHSLVPTDPVLKGDLFPWAADMERDWEAVRAEVMAVLQHRERLPCFHDISPDQAGITVDDKWRTFFFYGFGRRSELNSRTCPRTASLLDRIPGIENAFFSILAPGKIIPSHTGITKGLIRGHLGLVVPAPPAECFMDVDDSRCTWREGEVLLFDDTFPHAVKNIGDQERVVLLFDFARPMRWRGRLLRAALFWAARRTAYVRDALRNEARWSRAYHASGA